MNVEIIPLQIRGDDRGGLIALEEMTNVPFEIKRVYYIFNTKPNVRRGFHAHKALRQLAIAVKGSCKFLLDDGESRREVLLNDPGKGLLLSGLVWREMFDFTEDCVLLVLADQFYDETDYIRNYEEFQRFVAYERKRHEEEIGSCRCR